MLEENSGLSKYFTHLVLSPVTLVSPFTPLSSQMLNPGFWSRGHFTIAAISNLWLSVTAVSSNPKRDRDFLFTLFKYNQLVCLRHMNSPNHHYGHSNYVHTFSWVDRWSRNMEPYERLHGDKVADLFTRWWSSPSDTDAGNWILRVQFWMRRDFLLLRVLRLMIHHKWHKNVMFKNLKWVICYKVYCNSPWNQSC